MVNEKMKLYNVRLYVKSLQFLAAALAACSSSQYHVVALVVVVVLVVPELLSKFEFLLFLRVHCVAKGLLRVNSG